MTENLLIPQRMLYQIPGDSRSTKRNKEGKSRVHIHDECMCVRDETDGQDKEGKRK